MSELGREREPLLPVRHSVPDFFVCDLFDAVPKGDMASMEHPVFSISTKPDRRIRRYEHNGKYVEIRPNVIGLATVHDRDVLIFCISQLIAALNDGKPVSKVLRFRAHDLLVATNRNTAGSGYAQLKAAFERLQSTQIETNLITGGREEIDTFSLVDRVKIVRETRDGRMVDVEVTLSDWVFNAIEAKEVLTIHPHYFRLRKPLERRAYELARKHCGQQNEWSISLDLLKKKCGSNSSIREFRRLIRSICLDDEQHGHFPDYQVRFDEGRDKVTFTNRRQDAVLEAIPDWVSRIRLDAETYEAARDEAPGWDIYNIEQEWRSWMASSSKGPPRKPDMAFVAFCAKWFEKRGRPD